MADERDTDASRTRSTPSQADPAETVERLVPRRQLRVADDDVVMIRTPGCFRPDASPAVYQLRVHGHGFLADCFAGFEHAAVAGEGIAQAHKVRFFLQDAAHAAVPPAGCPVATACTKGGTKHAA